MSLLSKLDHSRRSALGKQRGNGELGGGLVEQVGVGGLVLSQLRPVEGLLHGGDGVGVGWLEGLVEPGGEVTVDEELLAEQGDESGQVPAELRAQLQVAQ